MKKTPFIRMVLITAALASCNRPMYQQQQQYMPEYEPADSTNASPESCPIAWDDLPPDFYIWNYSFRSYGMFFGGSYPQDLYYSVVRAHRHHGNYPLVRPNAHGTMITGNGAGILRNGFGNNFHTVVS
jgi:hypothetical protein